MLKRTLIVLVAAAATLPLAAQEGGGPKMVVPEMVVDLGEIAQSEVVDANFKIVNEGSEPLIIKSVRPTCGCTVASFDREIAPGKFGWVKAKLDTKDFEGPIAKSILVMTNDPQTASITLVIKATVRPYLEVLPRKYVRFNAFQTEEATQKVVVVATDPERKFTITKVQSDADFLTGKVRRLQGDELIPGKPPLQYEIELKLAKDTPIGPLKALLTVATDHPKAPQLEIKVFGVVRSFVHVTPSEVQFTTVEAKTRPGRAVAVVNNRPGVDVEVTGVEIDDQAFEVMTETVEQGKRYRVTVIVKKDAPAGAHDATMVIHTTDEEFARIEIPVRAQLIGGE